VGEIAVHKLTLTTLCLLPFTLTHSFAQEVADRDAGRRVAVEVCSPCHAVLPGEGVDPNPDPLPFEELVPLPFEDIANTPGATEMMLYAWMTTTHPTMPDVVLEHEELRDVVAYILSLREAEL
jgi:mono/diheme cytochrome c family protein